MWGSKNHIEMYFDMFYECKLNFYLNIIILFISKSFTSSTSLQIQLKLWPHFFRSNFIVGKKSNSSCVSEQECTFKIQYGLINKKIVQFHASLYL